MKILFTGATGVLGEDAVPRLLQAGHDITAAARSDADRNSLSRQGARPEAVDLFDPGAVLDAVTGIDAIIHFATSIPPQAAMTKRRSWDMNDRLRSEATSNLVDAAIASGVQRFVQQSVTFSYADGGGTWLDEDAPIEPVWDILDSALEAERQVDRFREAGGSGIVLRLSRVYGPGRASSDYIESIRSRKLPIVGDGRNFVSSIHTADVGSAVVASLSAPDGTYNISDDEPQPSGALLGHIAAGIGAPSPRRVPGWLGRLGAGKAARLLTVSHRVSNRRFKQATGWRPEYGSAVDGWQDVVNIHQKA